MSVAVSHAAIAKYRAWCLAAVPWLPRARRCAAAGTLLCRCCAAVSQSRELTPPSGIRPCFSLQTYCLIRKKKSFFLFVRVYIVMPYLDLHLSQQILRNFSSVHMSGVELKNMGQQILGSYPVHFHLAEDVDERGGYKRPTYLDNLAIHHCFSRCVAIHGTHGLLVGDIFY